MTTRSTTLVESDQLAQAAANVLQNEDFLPRGKRWPFSRLSKAHRDYEKAVQDITARRRRAREEALTKRTNKQRAEVDAVFQGAEQTARSKHDAEIAQAREPYDAVETKARAERDAAIAAANRAYQAVVDEAERVYQQAAAVVSQKRDEAVAEAQAARDTAYTAVDAQHKADMDQINKDLRTVSLEGLMRIVEDREVWSPFERQKALIGLIGMAGREDADADYANLCLLNVAGYIFQDRYLPVTAQAHKLMDAAVLEAFAELAHRSPEKRPTIVKYLHEIVTQNPGHTSPNFIKSLTQLYVIASTDADTVYDPDPVENERHFEAMLAHIADTLKLTPRRSQPPASGREPTQATRTQESQTDGPQAQRLMRDPADITADVNIDDLVQFEAEQPPAPESAKHTRAEREP